MGKRLDRLPTNLQNFIADQKIFFVATARKDGRINISPKGLDGLRIINPNRVVWLNLTGSGNETAIHLLENSRMTIMFCAFEGAPLILRLYGRAKAYHEGDEAFNAYKKLFPVMAGTRQFIELEVDLVQTSCGFGVPLMEFQSERTKLAEWTSNKGVEGLKAYQVEKNSSSIDGFETDVFKQLYG